ncbi:MAG TPA: hypothetical protein VJQ43_01940 [Thermoplasmata archaeon]|nr:hypothetical protein [Thermoplasmata archaeon]
MRVDDPGAIAPTLPTALEAPDLGSELLARYRDRRPVRPVSVTDLLDPRPAYWRSVSPIPTTPAQAARLRGGRRFHEALGRRLAPAEAREVRVRWNGIVGRIDILDGHPVELKSTDSPPEESDDLRTSRPAYIEQLAMYAALAGRADGTLVVARPSETGSPWLGVWDLSVRDGGAVRQEMALRAGVLRRALELGDPAELPRCAWFARNCPYRSSKTCDCSGEEPPISGAVLSEVDPPRPNPAEAVRIAGLWRTDNAGELEEYRFRDLAYPRRAWFDAANPEGAEPELTEPSTPDETWGALQSLLEETPPGHYEFRYSPEREIGEPIACWRGEPCLVKTSRALRPTPAERIVAERPHYVLELALRCASLGSSSGWLVLGLERVPSDAEWIRTQRVVFGSAEALRSLLAERLSLLREARRRGTPGELPRCPSWMFERCPHKAECGCGDASAVGAT